MENGTCLIGDRADARLSITFSIFFFPLKFIELKTVGSLLLFPIVINPAKLMYQLYKLIIETFTLIYFLKET